jgi:hypothetical protein
MVHMKKSPNVNTVLASKSPVNSKIVPSAAPETDCWIPYLFTQEIVVGEA